MISVIDILLNLCWFILLSLGLPMIFIMPIVTIRGRKNGLFKAILILIATAGLCYWIITIPPLSKAKTQPAKVKTQTLPQVLQTLHNTTKMCVKENLNLIKTKQDINSYNFNNCKISISDNILSCKCKTKDSIPKNIIYAQSICSNQNNIIKCNTEYQITHKHNEIPKAFANTVNKASIIVLALMMNIALGCVVLNIFLKTILAILSYEKKEKIALLVSTVISIIGTFFAILYFNLK